MDRDNAFYFILKALFVLKIFRYLSRIFGHARVAKKWFLWGSAKIELKISCEDFYILLLLSHHSQVRHSLPGHIFICLLKILNFWLWKNVTKNTKVKYGILLITIVELIVKHEYGLNTAINITSIRICHI